MINAILLYCFYDYLFLIFPVPVMPKSTSSAAIDYYIYICVCLPYNIRSVDYLVYPILSIYLNIQISSSILSIYIVKNPFKIKIKKLGKLLVVASQFKVRTLRRMVRGWDEVATLNRNKASLTEKFRKLEDIIYGD